MLATFVHPIPDSHDQGAVTASAARTRSMRSSSTPGPCELGNQDLSFLAIYPGTAARRQFIAQDSAVALVTAIEHTLQELCLAATSSKGQRRRQRQAIRERKRIWRSGICGLRQPAGQRRAIVEGLAARIQATARRLCRPARAADLGDLRRRVSRSSPPPGPTRSSIGILVRVHPRGRSRRQDGDHRHDAGQDDPRSVRGGACAQAEAQGASARLLEQAR